MRWPTLILLPLLLGPLAHGEFLTDAKRSELLEKLKKMQESAQRQTHNLHKNAIDAYEAALVSNEAALDLYLKCIEKVRFTDQRKDNREFRDWKTQNENNFSNASFKLAIRYQLKWLVLSLESTSENADQAALAAEAAKLLNTIYGDIDKVQDQSAVLKQSVLSSVFAQAYELGKVETKWPGSPADLKSIHETIIFPPLRSATRLAELNAAWDRRIQLEAIDATEWSNGGNGNRKDRDKDREAREQQRDDRALRDEKFQTEIRPVLLWEKQLDLFKHGDEVAAAARMLDHINTHAKHPSCPQWLTALQELLAIKETAKADTP